MLKFVKKENPHLIRQGLTLNNSMKQDDANIVIISMQSTPEQK